MDPFSITAGAIGLADVCVRVALYLKDVKAASGRIANDIKSLISEIDSLRATSHLIKDTWSKLQHQKDPQTEHQPEFQAHSELLEKSLTECSQLVLELETSLDEIAGKSGRKVHGTRDGLMKVFRLQSREKETANIRQKLWTNRQNLSLVLQLVTLSFSQQGSDGQAKHDDPEVVTQTFNIQQITNQILTHGADPDHELIRAAVDSARKTIASVKPNKYFNIPRAVSSLYTGRDHLLRRLKATLLTDTTCQKRFVVYGIAGSGKTQFCCKFAEEVQDSFWGIFSINARSPQTLQQTFSELAEQVGVAPNEAAVKKWLASLQFPWLLFIDNADDKSMDIESYFPAGTRGFILIATRNQYNGTLGTVGDGFFDFDKETLDVEESSELLLKAAGERSRGDSTKEAAMKIAHQFGYLPLALVQAGKAILRRLCNCDLWNYLTVHDRMRERIRKARSRSRSLARSGSAFRGGIADEEDPLNMNVFSSYEVLFAGLENIPTLSARDAVDLLKLFSFMSNDSLRLEVLLAAVGHAKLERAHEQETAEKVRENEAENRTIWTSLSELIMSWAKKALEMSVPVLPGVLRDATFDESRLTNAMYQLESVSLISYQASSKSYSMHPLIHTWVRERPDMSYGEQALWCQAASSVLASSILLPPLNSVASAEALQTHLLKHVSHVQKCKRTIDLKLEKSRESRRHYYQKRPWHLTNSIMSAQMARELAKFSLIYVINGYYEEAEDLLTKVREFVRYRLGGLDNPTGWRVTGALSNVYMASTNFKKAADLRVEMFESCKKKFGENDPHTLKLMDSLGEARLMQGSLTRARELHETALKGMVQTLEPNDANIFIAKLNLGKCMWRYFEYPKSYQLYREAWEGLLAHEDFGETHSTTLEAKENMALSCIDIPGSDLVKALEWARSVKKVRKERLGKNNPLTLLARMNISRIRIAMGDSVRAEHILRKARVVAERDLSEDHLGVLAGKVNLASALMCQGKYGEAEELLCYVVQPHLYYNGAKDDGEHPDRIVGLKVLVRCYREQAKFAKALEVCDQMLEAISSCGGQGLGVKHPMMRRAQAERMKIEEEKRIADMKLNEMVVTATKVNEITTTKVKTTEIKAAEAKAAEITTAEFKEPWS